MSAKREQFIAIYLFEINRLSNILAKKSRIPANPQLEQQRAAAAAAEERHGAEVRRALLDVDRERGNAAKLQKEVEQARRDLASQAQAHREDTLQRQQQLEALHQRSGELEGRAAQLLAQRDQLSQELQATRLRLEAVGAKRVSGVRAAKGGATKPSRTP